ncbi:MAG: TolC family protein, partial [Rhizobacter sp.]
MSRRRSLPPLLLLVAALAGCAGGPPVDVRDAATAAPAQWHAPLPHDGRIDDLNGWWKQFDDPLLSDLQAAAQVVNPTLASARSRIEQSRATRVAAGASLLPTLDASANASRSRQQPDLPVSNAYTAALQAGWEIDLFGRNQAAWEAARARYAGAQAGWHEARVAVAAEVASTYLQLRSCEAQLVKVQADTTSRNETSRLTDLATKAGFQAPAAAALARATAAQGNA